MADDLVVRECPFCGVVLDEHPTQPNYWIHGAPDCRATGTHVSCLDAAHEWNKRSDSAYLAVVAERDAAKLDHSLLSDDHRDLMQDVDGLRAQLATVTAERDEAKQDASRHIQWAKTAEAAVNAIQAQLTASEAARGIGGEIMAIMETYHQQEAERGYVDTPGGLEHMGDVWRLLSDWDDRLRALAEPGKAGEP